MSVYYLIIVRRAQGLTGRLKQEKRFHPEINPDEDLTVGIELTFAAAIKRVAGLNYSLGAEARKTVQFNWIETT